ncbi:MAG: phage tail assembly protein [Actinomycetota bacterium]|nr:phage tail assembly protein [Actinomycetota bacterium]
MIQTQAPASLVTRYPFTLPRGYVDGEGVVHREGVMRLATAGDEIYAQSDPRTRANPVYLSVLLLASTVERIGTIRPNPVILENLFASDLAFLQELYQRANTPGSTEADVQCPVCGSEFIVDVAGDGLRG